MRLAKCSPTLKCLQKTLRLIMMNTDDYEYEYEYKTNEYEYELRKYSRCHTQAAATFAQPHDKNDGLLFLCMPHTHRQTLTHIHTHTLKQSEQIAFSNISIIIIFVSWYLLSELALQIYEFRMRLCRKNKRILKYSTLKSLHKLILFIIHPKKNNSSDSISILSRYYFIYFFCNSFFQFRYVKFFV